MKQRSQISLKHTLTHTQVETHLLFLGFLFVSYWQSIELLMRHMQ